MIPHWGCLIIMWYFLHNIPLLCTGCPLKYVLRILQPFLWRSVMLPLGTPTLSTHFVSKKCMKSCRSKQTKARVWGYSKDRHSMHIAEAYLCPAFHCGRGGWFGVLLVAVQSSWHWHRRPSRQPRCLSPGPRCHLRPPIETRRFYSNEPSRGSS